MPLGESRKSQRTPGQFPANLQQVLLASASSLTGCVCSAYGQFWISSGDIFTLFLRQFVELSPGDIASLATFWLLTGQTIG